MTHLGIANRVKTITEENSEKVCQKVTVHDKDDTLYLRCGVLGMYLIAYTCHRNDSPISHWSRLLPPHNQLGRWVRL